MTALGLRGSMILYWDIQLMTGQPRAILPEHDDKARRLAKSLDDINMIKTSARGGVIRFSNTSIDPITDQLPTCNLDSSLGIYQQELRTMLMDFSVLHC